MSDFTDPMHASARALSRRSFAALSAGATAFGPLTSALAQSSGFGKPHPPIVSEDDPAITINRPQIGRGDRKIDSYFAAPRDAAAAPGVVVVQAIWGIDAQLRDTVRRFAKQGYAAIAPDLYFGLGAPSGDGATLFAPFRDVAAKLVDATVDADISAALAYLRDVTGNARLRVGITGFCMGGGIALRQTVDDTAFAAASVFYGKVRYGVTGGSDAGPVTRIALAYADEIAVPLAGSWGERDTSIAAADVRALDAKLKMLGKAHDFKTYASAGHAFFDDTRDSYEPAAAADAWTRTLVWFGQHLA